jgi:hypothetical protein
MLILVYAVDYDVHYFQDANTTDHANDTSTHHNSNYSSDRHPSPLLHYHRSTRGRSVQIITQNHHHNHQQQHGTAISPSPLHLPTTSFSGHSPLYALSKVESTHDVYKLQSTRQQTRPLSTPNDISGIPPYQPPTDHGCRRATPSTSNIVAPSLPPVVPPNYTLYGPIMSSSSTGPLKKMQQPSPKSSGGEDDLNLVFYPSRSTPTHGTLSIA